MTVKNFQENRVKSEMIDTDPFYTDGYKLKLCVYPNGVGIRKTTHVSVAICLMRGENDFKLRFPFHGIFIVRLLNWKQDSNHIEKTIVFDEATPGEKKNQVTTGDQAEYHYKRKFLSLDAIDHSDDELYVHEDRMTFEVEYQPLPKFGQYTTFLFCMFNISNHIILLILSISEIS